jgi:O-antigen ligase
MILKALKYCILFFLLCNIPSYLLAYFGGGLGSLSSYTSSLLLITFYFLVKKKSSPLIPFFLLGIFYFLISSINYNQIDLNNYFIKEFIRVMIVIVCGAEVLHKSNSKDIYIIVLIGAISVIVNAFIFPLANANFYPTYGRYSGFYLNPNYAGSICLIGYALAYSFKGTWKMIGLAIFTLAGILTFSRTFIIIWLVISTFAIINNKKNLLIPVIGILVLVFIFAVSDKLTLNTERFDALESIFSSSKTNTKVIKEDSRIDTWAIYYDSIFDRPFLGNGFESFQRKQPGLPGVHNSYLMVIGEAGILPFIILIGIYFFLLKRTIKYFKSYPEYFFLTCVLILSLLANHGYFNNF